MKLLGGAWYPCRGSIVWKVLPKDLVQESMQRRRTTVFAETTWRVVVFVFKTFVGTEASYRRPCTNGIVNKNAVGAQIDFLVFAQTYSTKISDENLSRGSCKENWEKRSFKKNALKTCIEISRKWFLYKDFGKMEVSLTLINYKAGLDCFHDCWFF